MASTEDRGSERTKLNLTFKWVAAGLNRAIKGIRFAADEEGFMWGQPVILAGANSTNDEVVVNDIEKANSDTISSNQVGILTRSINYVMRPGTPYLFERLRTPTLFKQVTVTASGNGTIWTAVAAKNIRVMGGVITVSKDAACAGALYVTVGDATGSIIFGATISLGALVATGQVTVIPFNFPGNGFIAPVNTAIYSNLSGACTSGNITFSVWGCEE